MQLTVALAQIAPKLANLSANLEKHLDYVHRAADRGAALVIFPELSLTGYTLQDAMSEVALPVDPRHPVFLRLLAASRRADIVFGFVEEDARHRFHIAAAYLSRGAILHIHRKVYLPTYGIFDEGRFFAPGDRFRAFETRWGCFGILICEDFWHVSSPYLLWLDGADLCILTSASPGRGVQQPVLESAHRVETLNHIYAEQFTNYFIHVNRVGFEDGLNFWGGSTIYAPNGDLVAKAPYDQETLLLHTLDLNQIRRSRLRLPLLRDERATLVYRELGRILRKEEDLW
jgi:predicted amidohydrolase